MSAVRSAVLISQGRTALSPHRTARPHRRVFGRELSDAELGDKIVDIFTKSRGTYGAPRITTALAEAGICVGQKRVAASWSVKA